MASLLFCPCPLPPFCLLSQSAAPHLTSVVSEDSRSVVVVQHIPDTNTPSNPTTQQQQQRTNSNNPLSSEYSLFDLETLFTHWAPNNESVSASTGPPCSFTSHDLTESDQDGVIIIENQPESQQVIQTPHVTVSSAPRVNEGQTFSSAISCSVSQGNYCTSVFYSC